MPPSCESQPCIPLPEACVVRNGGSNNDLHQQIFKHGCNIPTGINRQLTFNLLVSNISKLLQNQQAQDLQQHGMARLENRLERYHNDDDHENDSGFGSAGSSVYKRLHHCNTDLEKLESNVTELSACCFYYGSLNSQEARDILRKKPIGTFLLRDSSDSRYLYSLSLKTERGATSVRIMYNKGLFQFDSDEKIRKKLPCFESVLALLDFHVMFTQSGNNKSWRWEDNSGKKSMKVSLKEPLKCSIASLAHLSRVKVNQCLEDVFMPHLSVDKLPVSSQAKDYLKAYPYRV